MARLFRTFLSAHDECGDWMRVSSCIQWDHDLGRLFSGFDPRTHEVIPFSERIIKNIEKDEPMGEITITWTKKDAHTDTNSTVPTLADSCLNLRNFIGKDLAPYLNDIHSEGDFTGWNKKPSPIAKIHGDRRKRMKEAPWEDQRELSICLYSTIKFSIPNHAYQQVFKKIWLFYTFRTYFLTGLYHHYIS